MTETPPSYQTTIWPETPAERISGDVVELIRLLAGRGRWTTGAEISIALPYEGRPNRSDRRIRAAAADSEGEIISSDEGYMLMSVAAKCDYEDARGRLTSQIKRMQARVIEYDLAWHSETGV